MTNDVYIHLRGGRADRFRQIEEEMADQLGYEPTHTECVGVLMAGWDIETDGRPKLLQDP